MKVSRVYGNIQSVSDLNALQKKAEEHGLTAVGILDSGSMHKLVGFSSQPITKDEAAKLLDVSLEQLDEIVKFRGRIAIQDEVVQEYHKPSDAAVVDEPSNHENDNIDHIEVESHEDELDSLEKQDEEENDVPVDDVPINTDVTLPLEDYELLKDKADNFDYLVGNLNDARIESELIPVSKEHLEKLTNDSLRLNKINSILQQLNIIV